MKNTWSGDRVLGRIKGERKGEIEAEACGIMSGREQIKPTEWARENSVVEDRHWNTERERLRWFKANLDAYGEHLTQMFIRETEIAPSF